MQYENKHWIIMILDILAGIILIGLPLFIILVLNELFHNDRHLVLLLADTMSILFAPAILSCFWVVVRYKKIELRDLPITATRRPTTKSLVAKAAFGVLIGIGMVVVAVACGLK